MKCRALFNKRGTIPLKNATAASGPSVKELARPMGVVLAKRTRRRMPATLLMVFLLMLHLHSGKAGQPVEAPFEDKELDPLPTKRPTRKPAKEPTDPKPTRRPNREPSMQRPMNSPVRSPTRMPTRRPTRMPTRRPTRRPTNMETSRPTRRPTRMPTRRPTPRPTPEPTPAPGEPPRPMELLFPQPTVRPSESPSGSPTEVPLPFNPGSDLPVQRLLASNVEMTIGDILLPFSEEDAKDSFEVITSDAITRSIISVLGRDNIENLEMGVYVIPPFRRRHRKLSVDASETVLFDALILIQSVVTTHNVNRYIVGAFNDPYEEEAFLDDLKGTGYDDFQHVTSASVAPITNVTIMPPWTPSDSSETKDANVAAIVIPTVVAVLAIVASIVVYNRKRTHQLSKDAKDTDKNNQINDDGSKIDMIVNTTMETSNMSILEDHPEDHIVDAAVDLSSLGEGSLYYMHGGGFSTMGGSNTVGGMSRMSDKVSVDFDFKNMQIRTGIPILDEDETFMDEDVIPEMSQKPTLEELPESADGRSSIGPISHMSGLNGNRPPTKFQSLNAETLLSMDLVDYEKAVLGVVGEEKQAATPPEGFSGGSVDGSSALGSMSLLSAPDSLDYEYFKAAPRKSGKKQASSTRELVLRNFDDIVEVPVSMSRLGSSLSLEESKRGSIEEDISVADSMPRYSNKSLFVKGGTIDTVDEDITVTDSLSRVSESPPKGKKDYCDDDDSLADMSRLSDSLVMEGDFESSNHPSKQMSECSSIDFGYSNGYGTGQGQGRNKGDTIREAIGSLMTREGPRVVQFQVTAPKGMLGFTIETSKEGGAPVVNVIRHSSPLAEQVRVGDWLIKLDDTDVTSMPEKTVNRLIASKKGQKYRHLVFARTVDEVVENVEDDESIYVT